MAVREARIETLSCVPIKGFIWALGGLTAAVAFLTFPSLARYGPIRCLACFVSLEQANDVQILKQEVSCV